MLLQDGGVLDAITNAPTGDTTAEKILIWICVIQFLLLIASNFAQWRRTEKIHQSHKDAIREQEAAYAKALQDQHREDMEARKEIMARLIAMIEKDAEATKAQALAMQTLAGKLE